MIGRALVVGLISTAALAQTPDPTPFEDADADIRVTGRPMDPAAPLASQRRVRTDSAPGASTDVTRLIERSPGVQVRRSGGVGAPATLSIRGAGGHQVRVLLDDIPLDLVHGGGVDLSQIPVSAVETVTVLRGALGASYGSGAQGGVLKLRLRDSPLSEMSARIGSFGVGQLSALGGAGSTMASVQLARGRGDFPFTDVNGAARVRSNNDDRRLGAVLQHAVGDLRVIAQGQVLVRGEPGLEQFEGDGRSATRQGLLGLSWRGESVTLAAWARRERYRFEQRSQVLAGQVDEAEFDGRQLGGRARIEHHVATVESALEATIQRESTDTHARHRATLTASGLWGRTHQATAAVRLDATDQRSPILAPHVGVRWALFDALSAQANVGRLFRDPSFDELYFQGAGLRGDPNLRPEDGWGGDLGLRLRRGLGATARIDAELTGFAQRYDRVILFVPVSAWLVEAQDRFAADALGLEAAMNLRVARVRLRLSHLEQRVEFRGGPRLPFRPDRLTSARARYPLPLGAARPLTVFGGARWTAAVTTDAFGRRQLPGYLWLDAGAAWDHRAWRVSVQADNLTNAQALDALQRPQPGLRWLLGVRWRPDP